MSTAEEIDAMPDFGPVLGGMIMGIGFGLILYGITVAQCYVYMLTSAEDRNWIKWLVSIIFVLETCHTGFVFVELYQYTIRVIESPSTVDQVHWSVGAILFCSNVVAALVEGFYIRRQWILSRSWTITITTTLLLLARTGIHLVVSVESYISPNWSSFHDKPTLNGLVQTTLILEAALDALLAVSMVYCLRREKSTYMGMKGIITWLMMYAVHSGVLLMAVAVTVVITFVAVKDSLLFAGFIAIIGKLYANSLLGTLNARQFLRSKNSDPIVNLGSNHIQLSSLQQGVNANQPQSLRVHISQEISTISDKEVSRDLKPLQDV